MEVRMRTAGCTHSPLVRRIVRRPGRNAASSHMASISAAWVQAAKPPLRGRSNGDEPMTLRTNFQSWMDERAPGVDRMLKKHVTEYYAPKNFNFWYYFGTCSLVVLVNQIVTGIFLAMNFTPTAAGAFDSVQYIMRDVHWGWLIRYMHTTGASLFFVAIYLHMFRGVMYGSFKRPRELVWLLGILVLLLLMTEAFMGY